MKTKKLIAIVVLAALGLSAQAQIVSSRSDQVVVTQQVKEKKPKKPRTFNWNIRLGYSMDYLTGGEELSMASGFDASFGISKSIGSDGLFWGIEAGAMTHGACMEDSNPTRSIGVNLTPRIGVRIPFVGDVALNIYGGPYVGYRFHESSRRDIYYMDSEYIDSKGEWQFRYQNEWQELCIDRGLDAGVNVGVELFVSKNFFFNLHVKKGLVESGKSKYFYNNYDSGRLNPYNDYEDKKKISSLKIVAGIGFQF